MGKLGSSCVLVAALLAVACGEPSGADLFGAEATDGGQVHTDAPDRALPVEMDGGAPQDAGRRPDRRRGQGSPQDSGSEREGAAERDARAIDAAPPRPDAPPSDPTDAWDGERAIAFVRQEDCADTCLGADWGGFEWTGGNAPYCVCRYPLDGKCDVAAPWSTEGHTACPVSMRCTGSGTTCSGDQPGDNEVGEECGIGAGYCRAGLCCPSLAGTPPPESFCEVCE